MTKPLPITLILPDEEASMSVPAKQVKLSVRAYPNAHKNEVVGFTDRVLHVKVAAPPVQGKANKELVAFLSEALSVSKSRVTILKGETSKNKLLAIEGLSEEEVRERVEGKRRLV